MTNRREFLQTVITVAVVVLQPNLLSAHTILEDKKPEDFDKQPTLQQLAWTIQSYMRESLLSVEGNVPFNSESRSKVRDKIFHLLQPLKHNRMLTDYVGVCDQSNNPPYITTLVSGRVFCDEAIRLDVYFKTLKDASYGYHLQADMVKQPVNNVTRTTLGSVSEL